MPARACQRAAVVSITRPSSDPAILPRMPPMNPKAEQVQAVTAPGLAAAPAPDPGLCGTLNYTVD